MVNFHRPFGMALPGIVCVIAMIVLTSCVSVGPNTIPRDQFDYCLLYTSDAADDLA